MNGTKSKLLRKVANSTALTLANKNNYNFAQTARLEKRLYKDLKRRNAMGGQ